MQIFFALQDSLFFLKFPVRTPPLPVPAASQTISPPAFGLGNIAISDLIRSRRAMVERFRPGSAFFRIMTSKIPRVGKKGTTGHNPHEIRSFNDSHGSGANSRSCPFHLSRKSHDHKDLSIEGVRVCERNSLFSLFSALINSRLYQKRNI